MNDDWMLAYARRRTVQRRATGVANATLKKLVSGEETVLPPHAASRAEAIEAAAEVMP